MRLAEADSSTSASKVSSCSRAIFAAVATKAVAMSSKPIVCPFSTSHSYILTCIFTVVNWIAERVTMVEGVTTRRVGQAFELGGDESAVQRRKKVSSIL